MKTRKIATTKSSMDKFEELLKKSLVLYYYDLIKIDVKTASKKTIKKAVNEVLSSVVKRYKNLSKSA